MERESGEEVRTGCRCSWDCEILSCLQIARRRPTPSGFSMKSTSKPFKHLEFLPYTYMRTVINFDDSEGTQSTYMYIYMYMECHGFESHPRQLIFLRKSDCLGCAVLLCLVCLFDLACFFLSSLI